VQPHEPLPWQGSWFGCPVAQASEQKLLPSRKTAWSTCTSQVQRGQAQEAEGAIKNNQLTFI